MMQLCWDYTDVVAGYCSFGRSADNVEGYCPVGVVAQAIHMNEPKKSGGTRCQLQITVMLIALP